MSSIQACRDTTEATELCEQLGLYLKPIARLNICIQLPLLKTPGKSISNWEVMEKLKRAIKPDEFTVLKISKTTLEFIRFEGEVENKSSLKAVISRLDNSTIKLGGFPDNLKVRAAEAKVVFPTRHDWDSYFRDAKNMDEMKPGERPDTIYLQGLPCKWFTDRRQDSDKPSEFVLKQVFDSLGEVRCVDIPILDPYQKEANKSVGKIQTFTFGQDLTFDSYVQYREYMGFVKAMDSLRGMKLMYKAPDGKAYTANIKVEFDKSKHLSAESIKKRHSEKLKLISLEKEREERVRKEREQEEKQKDDERRRLKEEEKERERKREEKVKKRDEKKAEREERHRQKEEERKIKEEKEQRIHEQAMEERKKLKAQRRSEAKRLLQELFQEIKVRKQEEEIQRRLLEAEEEKRQYLYQEEKRKREEARQKEEEEKLRQKKLLRQEQVLREKLIKNLRVRKELHMEELREKLRKEIAGKNVLKSVLVTNSQSPLDSTNHSDSYKLKSSLKVP